MRLAKTRHVTNMPQMKLGNIRVVILKHYSHHLTFKILTSY